MPSQWLLPIERLLLMAVPNAAALLAQGTGSVARSVVAARGPPTGDGSPKRRLPTGWWDGDSCPVGPLPMERMRGMVSRNGVGSLATGMGNLALWAAASRGARAGGWQSPMACAH